MMFAPLNKRADGTFVFASPVGDGHVPMIALEDLGWWARYAFDHRAEVSATDLEVASDVVGWDYLVSTFKNVTGQKAVFLKLTPDEWFNLFDGTDHPVANEREYGDGSTTWKENFSAFWSLWRDDVIKRDLGWIRSVHPGTHDLEKWMKKENYRGEWKMDFLKNVEDGKAITLKFEALAQL